MSQKYKEVNKKLVVQALIDKLEKENQAVEIKTSVVEGFGKPESIFDKDHDKLGYTPDIISEADGRKDVYEVELDLEKEQPLEKWRLFYIFTKESNGRFNVVVPKEDLEHTKLMLREHNIFAEIIYFS